MYLKENIKTTSFKVLASLACFTGGASNNLWSVGVTTGTETGTVTSCTGCGVSGNTCCTFLDALNSVGAFTSPGPTSSQTIDLTQISGSPHTVTYTGTIGAGYVNVFGKQITISGGNNGGIVDFNGQTSGDGQIDFEVGLNSKVILDGTVFQNTTGNGNVIFNNGTLQINGTSVNGHLFEDIAWDMGAANSTVSLIFGVASKTSSTFASDFPGNILIGAGQTNSTLLLQNVSGSSITIASDIFYSDGASTLTIYPASAGTTLTFTGDISSVLSGDTLGIDINVGSGNVVFTGTNEIDNLYLYGSTLSVPSVSSLGGTAVDINFLGGTLDLTAGMTLPNTIPITVATYGSASTSSLITTGTTVIQGSVTGTSGTTFDVTPGGSLTFSGAINLDIMTLSLGTGTTTFSAANTINSLFLGGTLIVSSAAQLGSGSTDIIFGGTAGILQVSGSPTLANSINLETGTGTLNSTSGTTTVSGTVTGGGGNILTLTGNNSLGTIDVPSPNTNAFTINGKIVTGQTLTKTGSGALILTGTSSTYTGATHVTAGSLVVNQTITTSSGFTVGGAGSAALLLGTGTVTATTVSSGSGIKGGTTFGTLTVNGALALQDGSFFGTAISPGSVSLVASTGAVTIGDTELVILFQPSSGTYSLTPATILIGASITGEFDSVNINGLAANFLTANLTYHATSVTLGLKERSVATLSTGGNANQVADALDGAIAFNRTEVAYTLTPAASESLEGLGATITLGNGATITASPTPQLADVLASLISFTTETEMTYALNQLQPSQMKGMAISQENNAVRVRESLSQRMLNDLDADNCQPSSSYHEKDTTCCEKDKRMITTWVSGLGDTLKQDNKNNSSGPLTGYRANTGGVVTGVDALFAEFLYAGALGAYTHSHLHFQDGKGTGDISSGYAGVYLSILGPQLFGGGFLGDLFFANISVIGSWSEYSADRHIAYTGVNLTAKNSHGGNQLLSHFDTGLDFNWWGLTVRPFDSFDYITQTERGYAEHNAGEWELTVSKKNMIMLRNELGLQFAKCYCTCSSKWIVSPKFSWVREVRVKGDSMDVSFTQGGTPFVTQGYFPDRNLFVPGLAITGFMLQDALVFDLYYNGEFTGDYSSNSLGGQIGYSF